MRIACLFVFLLLGATSATAAAEQIGTFRVTADSDVPFFGPSLLPQPNGDMALVFGRPVQSGVCAGTTCITILRWNANLTAYSGFQPTPTALLDVRAAVADSRGRLIVIGLYPGPGADGTDFGIARFKADGSIDTSFSGDGITNVNFAGGASNDDQPAAVALDRDDNIIVAGMVKRPSSGDYDFGIARLRATDGSLDTGFQGSGKAVVFFDLGPDTRQDTPLAVAVRNDGRIVVAGSAYDSSISRNRAVMAQLNADGSFDTGFCNTSCSFNAGYGTINNGRRVYYFGALSAHSDFITGVDVAANNDIVVAGGTYTDDGTGLRPAIARFSSAGGFLNEKLEPGDGYSYFGSVRFADGYGTRAIATGVGGSAFDRFYLQAFTGSLDYDAGYGNCLSSNSGLCFTGGPGPVDAGPNAVGPLYLDARGRPLFAGSFLVDGDTTSRILVTRITNNTGPLPDRIFRNGWQ